MLAVKKLWTVSEYRLSRFRCSRSLVLYELAQLLNTHLDKETLATCVNLIEGGVNPDGLAVSV